MAEARGDWTSEMDDDTLITAKMVDMKMVDDVQQKQLIVELNAKGKVTDDYMWKALGLDPDRIRAGLRKEALAQIDDNFEIQKKQIDVEAKLQAYRAKVSKQYGFDQQEGGPNQSENPDAANAQQGQDPQQGADPNAVPPGQESQPTQEIQPMSNEEVQPAQEDASQEEYGRLYATAKQILRLPSNQRDTVLNSLPKSMQQQIAEIMSALESDEKREDAMKVDMRPYPQQKPPRRAGY